MATSIVDELGADDLALSVGRAMAAANIAASERGVMADASLVTISEESGPPSRVWRIHYGPRDFLNRRGGDLIVLVDEQTGTVQRVICGQ